MSFGRYALSVLGAATASLGVAWPLLPSGETSPDARLAVLFGAVLATLNALAAYALVLWATGRSTKLFLRALLGGMVGRMALMLAAVTAAILWLDLPALPLIIALLAYFVAFLAFELAVLQRKTDLRVEAR